MNREYSSFACRLEILGADKSQEATEATAFSLKTDIFFP